MKIDPKHNKIVRNAYNELRHIIVAQTVELAKEAKILPNDDLLFDNVLILHKTNKQGMLETIVADRMSYATNVPEPYYMLELNRKCFYSSFRLSLSNLMEVYNEVHKVISKY